MAAAIIGLVIANLLAGAYVTQCLWWWFIAPVFNLPAIAFGQAMGLSLMIAYLTHQTEIMPFVEKLQRGDYSETTVATKMLGTGLFKDLLALITGYLIKYLFSL